jgi:hypothetical protein
VAGLAVNAVIVTCSLDMLLTDQYMGVTVQSRSNVARALADFHPCPEGTAMDYRELTLTALLADPMVLSVMTADQVDPAALGAALSGLARRLELARPAAAGVCGRTVSGARGGSAFGEFIAPRQ